MAEHNELGKIGEELAVDFLTEKGYEILETNWIFQKAVCRSSHQFHGI